MKEGIKRLKKKTERKKEQRAKEFAVKLCLLELSEDTSIKSDQHDCLKMNRTRTIITDILHGLRKAQETSTPNKEQQEY